MQGITRTQVVPSTTLAEHDARKRAGDFDHLETVKPSLKLLLRGYDKNGALVESLTREFDVTIPGDGVYNVPTLSAASINISVVT